MIILGAAIVVLIAIALLNLDTGDGDDSNFGGGQ